MKGKKYKLLACRCCECQDLREKILNRVISKELFEDSNENDDEDLVDFWELVEEDKIWNEYKQR